MSDSDEDFLSADEGSDIEELPSGMKVVDNVTESFQTSVEPPTKYSEDAQTMCTSTSDISDSDSLHTQVEPITITSGTETTESINDLVLDKKEGDIKKDNNLHKVDTENNFIKESVSEKVLDKDSGPIKKKSELIVNDNIEETIKIEESKSESKAVEALTNKIDNIDLKDELQNIEMSNASPVDDKPDVQDASLNKLNNSDNIFTDEKENTSKSENISDESCVKPEFQSSNQSSVQKPIKTSKIGAKKSKEKLGVKLGAKKLGSKVTKKVEESDVHNNQKSIVESINENNNLENRLQEKKADITEEDANLELQRLSEAKRRQEEWEKQQSRWQEAQGIKPVQQSQQSQESSESGWGDWGNWGSTLISAVGTITHEVGRGVGTVMETVEGGLGVPDPETLAKELAERERQIEEEKLKKSEQSKESVEKTIQNTWDCKDLGKSLEEHQIQNETTRSSHGVSENEESQSNFTLTSLTGLSTNSFGGFGSMVTGASKVFETASNKVLLGGLDTLELIGQKAMDTIQKGDPGLKKKRAFLMDDTPNLSHTLREASQCAASKDQQKQITPQIPTLYQAWDNTEGPVHLEALSLVAKQCQGKTSKLMEILPPHSLTKLNSLNSEIKMCLDELSDDSLSEEGELLSLLDTIVEGDGLPIQIDKIKKAWSDLESTTSLVTAAGAEVGSNIECQFYNSLASLLSQMASIIHKNSEMALITPDVEPQDIAMQFKRLTGLICGSVDTMAENVCSFITAQSSAADPQVNNCITNIYLQVSEGSNYMQQCLNHLSTVLQYSNTKKCISDL